MAKSNLDKKVKHLWIDDEQTISWPGSLYYCTQLKIEVVEGNQKEGGREILALPNGYAKTFRSSLLNALC